ncbi:hypothetical protein [Actinoplanes sp. NPDC051851]|uniref:hypothetical protein n=1 Tax=Actinoplanes sp. NPDC051851 TaxID=3154753 RepID=UPI00342FFC4C
MDEIRIDSSDVTRLAARIDKTAAAAIGEVEQVVAKGSLNIKNGAKERIGRGPYLPRYSAAIGYDMWSTPTAVRSEIGPDKDKAQGPLGNILEYGSPGRAPRPHLGPAADEEEPRLERALEDAVVKAIEAGL